MSRDSEDAKVCTAQKCRFAVHISRQHALAAWQAEKVFIADLIAQGSVPGRRMWKREDLYDRGSASVGDEPTVSCSQHTATVS